MNFFKLHLGDYDGATMHLSWDEDQAYLRLMRVYYRDEKPIPLEERQIYRLTRAQSKPQRTAVMTVLQEFFTQQVDGWHNKRCDEEIAAAKAQAETNRRIANERYTNRGVRVNGSLTVGPPIQTPDSTIQTPLSNSDPYPTLPENREGLSLRELGENPRALGTNPRANGANPRAMRDERKQEALIAWNRLVNSGGSDGRELAPVQRGIKAAGGWQAIRMREQGADDAKKRGAFVNAYVEAAST